MPDTELVDLLNELRAELQVHNRPERRAYANLDANRYWWPAEPYAEEAFPIWEGLAAESPEDLNSLHHLAIMHHARAFDLEASDDPGRADADWERGLELWHQLWQDDRFWEQIGQRGDSDQADCFTAVRAEWPEQVLQTHFDIAFDETAKNYRARRHISLALDSPFPDNFKESVRLRTYERLTAHLPPVVWDSNTFDPGTLDPGLKVITRYLDQDEDFTPALTDLLGLLTKLQTGYVQKTNAADGAENFRLQLQTARTLHSRFDPHIVRLEARLSDLPGETVAELILWHSRGCQALRMLDDFEDAAALSQRALVVTRHDSADPKRAEEIREEWLHCVLLSARKHAAGSEAGEAKARELLQSIDGEEWLPPLCLLVRANTHLLLREFDAAENDCNAALASLRNGTAALDFAGEMAGLESSCEDFLGVIADARRQHDTQRFIEPAIAALQRKDWGTALRLLGQAAQVNPEHSGTFFLRAQCHMGLEDFASAQVDLDRAEQLARHNDETDAIEGIAVLRNQLVQVRQHQQIGMVLEQAEERAGANDFKKAKQICDRVVREHSDNFRALFLRAQCHMAADRFKAAKTDLDKAESTARRDKQTEAVNAVGKLRRTLKEMEDHRQVKGLLEQAAERAGAQDFFTARRLCDQVLQAKPDDFSALFLRTQCHMAGRDLDAAQTDLDRAERIALGPPSDFAATQAVAKLNGMIQLMRRQRGW